MWKRRRRIAALVHGLLFLTPPFIRVGGESAFRFDIPTLTLHLFGAAVPIEEFHLVLGAALFLLLVTVSVALAFGRLWCGWACLACAACIDACAGAVSGAGLAPFVAYRGRIARGKTLAAAGAAAAALALLAVLVAARPGIAFSVQWTGSDPATGVNRYRYVVRNDLDRAVDLRLGVEGGFALVGAPDLRVGPRGRTTGTVRLTREDREGVGRPAFVLSGDGISLRREAGYL